jgi:ABC-type proline/glycine betaine transport system substrate-binding protein
MDQGKGDIDVHPDVWLPNQEAFTNKYADVIKKMGMDLSEMITVAGD